ncbi:trypsin-like peptidase domain-containing protein [Candidatus Kaiserbacteria bacterium]|nr:trypsin-like peptidase domain-containing protein [Candidatus Kaiserbacteria bacterium]
MNMSRFTPYLGIIAALLFGVFTLAFFGGVVSSPPPESALPESPPSLSVASPERHSSRTETSAATSAPATHKTPPKKPEKPVAAEVPAPAPVAAPSSSAGALDAAASALRSALVNILCYVPSGSGLHSISGSGVMIDPKGVILTNAHIAQYFLLADRGVSCTIRAGTPAADRYRAALAYISPSWVSANARVIAQIEPTGTGEYDFALLAITKSATSAPLPQTFPSVPLALTPPSEGTPVVIASYGAQFLTADQIQSSLFPTIVFGLVKGVFTFATNTVDVFALGGSAAAQEGSSGGGVASASGELVGTITTSTIKGATETRALDAITASYIRAAYAGETGRALDVLLAGPISAVITEFSLRIPALEAVLVAQLP